MNHDPPIKLLPAAWVNRVPERYGAEWSQERRCRFLFAQRGGYGSQTLQGCPCGYPTEAEHQYCIFHRQGEKDPVALRAELQNAVAEGAYLSESQLSAADFSHLDLSNAKLGLANLSQANLSQTKLLRSSLFEANLRDANLYHADLTRGNLAQAELSGARLGGADFSGAKLRGVDLSGARLLGTIFHDAWLLGAVVTEETEMIDVHWWPDDTRSPLEKWCHVGQPMFQDERKAKPSQLKVCERFYRRIKRCYQASGQYDQAGDFFVREMECKRKQLLRSNPLRWVYGLLHFLCDYFENPWRVVAIGAIVILLGAFAQGAAGVHLPANPSTGAEGPAVAGPGLTWPNRASLQAFGHALYFSTITFTATGYGDYVPSVGWGQAIAAVETLTGVFLMATFLVCLARKFGRA